MKNIMNRALALAIGLVMLVAMAKPFDVAAASDHNFGNYSKKYFTSTSDILLS